MTYLLWHYVRDAARSYPSRIAIDAGDQSLSYAELDERSDRVARALLDAGVGRRSRVGLLLPKSPDGIVAMVGILKAGAAYVPIDPDAPAARGAFILEDCAVSALVTTSPRLAQLAPMLDESIPLRLILLGDRSDAPAAAVPVRRLHELEPAEGDRREAAATEIDPAYLLYTSGSTGDPKGVILSHRNAMSFVEWAVATVGVGADDRLSNHAPHHFDLSVFDIYAAFRAGASVVPVPKATAMFPTELTRWIGDQRITIWYSVPSALIRLLRRGSFAEAEFPSLRTVIFAGEVFPVKYLRGVMDCVPRAEFLNWYGPTETNVCTHYRVPRPLDTSQASIPIGRACRNTEVFAVDADDRPIEVGEEGELVVRGPTVMLGYWGLSEKTARQMLQDPRHSAYRDELYRTGDVVRLEENGDYTFVGRRDHLVKSRGYRIELGEIEAVLYQHASIGEAAAIAIPDDEIGARLAAVLVSSEGGDLDESEVRAFCTARLPRYMVPERFVMRTTLPRTSTGKIDRMNLVRELEQGASPAGSEDGST